MSIIKKILECSKFDVFICAEEFTSEKLAIVEIGLPIKNALRKKGIVTRILSFLKFFLSSTVNNLHGLSASTNYKVFVANNTNELAALLPVANCFEKSEVVWLGLSAKKMKEDYYAFNPIEGYLLGFLFIPIVLFKTLLAPRFKRSVVPYIFDHLLYGIGFLSPYQNMFKKINVTAVFVSNHNAPLSALMLELCVNDKAKSIYVEHTPVIARWPEIRCDHFFLSGLLSKSHLDLVNEKWRNYSIDLIGSPKNDDLQVHEQRQRQEGKPRIIGIGVNAADDYKKVIDLILKLRTDLPNKKFLIRAHPSMTLDPSILDLEKVSNVSFAHPSKQTLNEFFKSIDILIVNDSGLYFEAGYAGVLPLKYSLSDQISEFTVPNSFYKGLFTSADKLVAEIMSIECSVTDVRSEFRKVYHNIDGHLDLNSKEALRQGLDKLCL